MHENPYRAPDHAESRQAWRKWARVLLLVAIAAATIGAMTAIRQ